MYAFFVFIHKTVDLMIGKDKISNYFSSGNLKQKQTRQLSAFAAKSFAR